MKGYIFIDHEPIDANVAAEVLKTTAEMLYQAIELVKANRGALMRSISAELKGKADMKIVSAVVGDILN